MLYSMPLKATPKKSGLQNKLKIKKYITLIINVLLNEVI